MRMHEAQALSFRRQDRRNTLLSARVLSAVLVR